MKEPINAANAKSGAENGRAKAPPEARIGVDRPFPEELEFNIATISYVAEMTQELAKSCGRLGRAAARLFAARRAPGSALFSRRLEAQFRALNVRARRPSSPHFGIATSPPA